MTNRAHLDQLAFCTALDNYTLFTKAGQGIYHGSAGFGLRVTPKSLYNQFCDLLKTSFKKNIQILLSPCFFLKIYGDIVNASTR